jgi:hypothetical protein
MGRLPAALGRMARLTSLSFADAGLEVAQITPLTIVT